MAEGDEAARRQQPHQGLRRRRRTSDPNTGVNHVSSTTFLGTRRRGGARRVPVGRGRGPLGPAGTGRGRRGRRSRLAQPSSRRRVWRPPGLAPAAPRAPAARGLKGRPAGRGSRSCRENGRRARLRPGGPAPCPPAAWLPPRAPRPEGAALSRGRRPGARGSRRRRGWVLESSGRGRAICLPAGARRPLSLPWKGRDRVARALWAPRRRTRSARGEQTPRCQVGKLSRHPSRREPQSAGRGCVPGLAFRGSSDPEPIAAGCAWLGCKSRFSC